MNVLVRNMPQDVWNQFRKSCIDRGISANSALIQLVTTHTWLLQEVSGASCGRGTKTSLLKSMVRQIDPEAYD